MESFHLQIPMVQQYSPFWLKNISKEGYSCLSACLSLCLYVCLSVYLSVCVCLSWTNFSANQYVHYATEGQPKLKFFLILSNQ